MLFNLPWPLRHSTKRAPALRLCEHFREHLFFFIILHSVFTVLNSIHTLTRWRTAGGKIKSIDECVHFLFSSAGTFTSSLCSLLNRICGRVDTHIYRIENPFALNRTCAGVILMPVIISTFRSVYIILFQLITSDVRNRKRIPKRIHNCEPLWEYYIMGTIMDDAEWMKSHSEPFMMIKACLIKILICRNGRGKKPNSLMALNELHSVVAFRRDGVLMFAECWFKGLAENQTMHSTKPAPAAHFVCSQWRANENAWANIISEWGNWWRVAKNIEAYTENPWPDVTKNDTNTTRGGALFFSWTASKCDDRTRNHMHCYSRSKYARGVLPDAKHQSVMRQTTYAKTVITYAVDVFCTLWSIFLFF